MDYQILNNKIKLNKNKNIGKVIYIVEGERREINLLTIIFKRILGYKEIITRTRSGKETFLLESDENVQSKIAIINSEKSNISSIENEKFIEEQIQELKHHDLTFNYENAAIYYIFDGDRLKDEENIKKLIGKFSNSRTPSIENKFDQIGGMLLLSYPAIETFIISNFEKEMIKFSERFDFEKNKLKRYINDKKYDDSKLNEQSIENAFKEMINSLRYIKIDKINLDDISDFNKAILEYEITSKRRYMLSLLLISFIDLGIIEMDSTLA